MSGETWRIGAMYLMLFVVTMAFAFCNYVNGRDDGRCLERWVHVQPTPADTLRVVRSGCELSSALRGGK